MDEVNLSLLNIEPFHFQKGYITQVVQNNNWQLIDKLFSPLKRVKLNFKKNTVIYGVRIKPFEKAKTLP